MTELPTSNVKQLATRERIHKFEDGEETITVKTIELPAASLANSPAAHPEKKPWQP